MFWLRSGLTTSFAAGLALSPHLWCGPRFFPQTPLFAFLPPIPPPLEYGIFGAIFVLLAAINFVPRPAIPATICAVLVLALCAFDQSRLQPWVFQYVLMLLVLGRSASTSNLCRLIIVSVYFWSGIQKFNSGFTIQIFPWMMSPFAKVLPFLNYAVPVLALTAPAIEVALSLALLSATLRNAAVVAAIGMHLFILAAFGPFGLNVNNVIWPWNLAMILFLAVLFWNTSAVGWRAVVRPGGSVSLAVILLVAAVAPLFSVFNQWDHYLSWAMYTGAKHSADLFISDAVFDNLPEPVQDYVTEDPEGANHLNVETWSFRELNVPVYPEIRIYRNIARYVCTYAPSPADVRLEIRSKPSPVQASLRSALTCSDLAK